MTVEVCLVLQETCSIVKGDCAYRMIKVLMTHPTENSTPLICCLKEFFKNIICIVNIVTFSWFWFSLVGACCINRHQFSISSSKMGHTLLAREHWKWGLLCLHSRKSQILVLWWEENGKLSRLCAKISSNRDEIFWVCGQDASNRRTRWIRKVCQCDLN